MQSDRAVADMLELYVPAGQRNEVPVGVPVGQYAPAGQLAGVTLVPSE